MEAVARQFGDNKKCLVIRNGYFSYRWSQIFEALGNDNVIVMKAAPNENHVYSPPPIDEVHKQAVQREQLV